MIIVPCYWIIACLVWCIDERRTTAAIQEIQVYLTEHTLVFRMGNLLIESSRVTIPLANIATVMVQPGALTVNIKPTAPEVMLNRTYTTGGQHSSTFTAALATHSVPIYYVYNAEEFGKVIGRARREARALHKLRELSPSPIIAVEYERTSALNWFVV